MAWGQDRSDNIFFFISPTKYHPTLYNNLSRVEGKEVEAKAKGGRGGGQLDGNIVGIRDVRAARIY